MKIALLFTSSIGKKILMALSGLFYCVFIIGHLGGNFLLYVGKKEFNAYSDNLASTNLIYIAEFILVLALLTHIFTAISLTRENRLARAVAYKVQNLKGKSRTNSTYMALSGILILAFLILHIYTFKFGDWDNNSQQTLYDLVLLRFADGWYSAIYVIAMLVLGIHLNHAVKSSFHTLGILPKDNVWLCRCSFLFALVMTIGFSSFPIYFFITGNFFN